MAKPVSPHQQAADSIRKNPRLKAAYEGLRTSDKEAWQMQHKLILQIKNAQHHPSAYR